MNDQRKNQILKAIITQFIETAEPVGSKTVLVSYNFNVSPATIRSEMADLEKDGLITQPYTSAGRVPTDAGYRVFVDDLIDYNSVKVASKSLLKEIRTQFKKDKLKRQIHDTVALLSRLTNNMSFATLPDSRTFYLGMSNVLKTPEFLKDPMQASQVIEVFENNDNFINFLNQHFSPNLHPRKVEIFIGKENFIEQIQSCSLIVGQYQNQNYTGYIGLMGPTRMNYPLNTIILEEILDLFNQEINL